MPDDANDPNREPGPGDAPRAEPGNAPPDGDPRNRILATTARLLGEVGWSGITTRKVAQRANVNNALVHYYFGSKSKLLIQASRLVLEQTFREPMAALADPQVPVADAMMGAVEWLASDGLDPEQLRALVEITINGLQEPELAEMSKAMVVEGRAALTERLVAEGLAPDRAAAAAILAFALLDGIMLHRLIGPSLPVDDLASAVAPLFRKE